MPGELPAITCKSVMTTVPGTHPKQVEPILIEEMVSFPIRLSTSDTSRPTKVSQAPP